ncbi:phytoene desaturase family protein [Chenggangzhangella methanolivorans]
MPADRVVVIGAGIGGLVAAAVLARAGLDVTVVEKAARPGGKIRTVEVAGRPIDVGPTVFTMRGLMREIAGTAGFDLDAAVTLRPVETLARHAWGPEERLDLFADPARSADAIGDFSGAAEAKRFLAFHAEAAHVFRTLDHSFIRAEAPSRAGLVMGAGLSGLVDLARIRPFQTLWSTLTRMFEDPRLRQLFGRYATYCGSSPFSAPATLMLVAHVEMDGVWLVEGGMIRLAEAFARQAEANGATFRYGVGAARIEAEGGNVSGVTLESGEWLAADAILFNGDVEALGAGLLGEAPVRAAPRTSPNDRSLSAVTFASVARADGFPLARHTVFFSGGYRAEFDQIFGRSQLPEAPTVYLCAQDRDDGGGLLSDGFASEPPPSCPAARPGIHDLGDGAVAKGSRGYPASPGMTAEARGRRSDAPDVFPERLMLLVNAPPVGDVYQFGREEIARCERNALELLDRCGLTLEFSGETIATTPSQFAQMFPATGGALYGPASHGSSASFRRAVTTSRLPGLYLAGGSVHPGPGVPMAALSGWRAATSLIRDLASTGKSRRAATPGGISTAGARTAGTG